MWFARWTLLVLLALAAGCIAPFEAFAQSCGGLSQPPCPPPPPSPPNNVLYVPPPANLIVLANPGGVASFSPGQFSFTPSNNQPPIILPRSPSGFGSPWQSFAEEPRSDVASRTDEAFSALGFADGQRKAASVTKAPAQPREWSAWVNATGSEFKVKDSSGLGNDAKGNAINVVLGVGRYIGSDTLVGVMAGYERVNYDIDGFAASSRYDGETIGGYIVQGLGNVRFDAALGWTNLNYTSALGANSGTFGGSRWRLTSGLTGQYTFDWFVLQPSASILVAFERDHAWSDSAGNSTDANNVTAGRAAAGALVARPFATSAGWTISPYAGLYADRVFSSSGNAPAAGPLVTVIRDGWAGRATAGIAAAAAGGAVLALGGEFGGVGAEYKIWKGNLRVGLPF